MVWLHEDKRRDMEQQQSRRETRVRLLKDLPIEERRLDVDGVSTSILTAGDGPPLVLLHGGIECGGAYWAPVIARLAEGHRVVIPDAPGLGESAPVPRLDAMTFADWLAALLLLTCEKPPTLVAHSLLGTLAGRFSSQHGELLRRLVIYAAPGIGPTRRNQPPGNDDSVAEAGRAGEAFAGNVECNSMVRRRAQREASATSWVTSTSVVPTSRLSSNSRSQMDAPVAVSRLPVGSSANNTAGRVTEARASATRCCSPPESCRG